MGERDDAHGSIEQSRDRMSAIVEELARRATPEYLGGRIKEATVTKTSEWKDRATTSRPLMALLGGGIGAAAGAYVANYLAGREAEEGEATYQRPGRRYAGAYVPESGGYGEVEGIGPAGMEGETAEGEGGGLKEKATQAAGAVKDRSLEAMGKVKERSREALGGARERVSGARYRTKSWFGRAWDEQPLLVTAGIAIGGAILGAMMPVTEKERKLAEPVRRKASEGIQKLGETIEEKIGGAAGTEEVHGTSLEEKGTTAIVPESDRPTTVH